MDKKTFIFCLLYQLLVSFLANAQELNQRDKNILRYEAGAFVKELELLLNNLSNEESAKFERDLIIKNSYSTSGNQIFLNQDVIIEDDINPKNYFYKRVTDLYVEKYLINFDIFYKKQKTKTILFSNVYVSEVKEGDYIYLEVFFNSEFKGSHLTYSESYQKTSRVATIIAKRKERIWDLKIASIVFYNPNKHSKLFNFNNTSQTETNTIDVEANSIKKSENKEIEESKINTVNSPNSNWQLDIIGSLSYESNINKVGIGSTLITYKKNKRIAFAINGRYLFKEKFNTIDTVLTANQISFSGLFFYNITNSSTGLVPYTSVGFNYLYSWVSNAIPNQETLDSSSLGLSIGVGVSYKKRNDDRLFFNSRLSLITGKTSRIYIGTGVGYLLFKQ